MKIRQFIHQMNFSEVNANQSYIRVDKDFTASVQTIIPRGVHVSFKGKNDGKNLSPNNIVKTWPINSDQIQTIGTIVNIYGVQPGDLIIFEKRENDDNIYVDCIKRDNVISVLRRGKSSDYYEILNESVLSQIKFPVKVMFDGGEYSLSIEDVGKVKKRSNSKSPQADRTQYNIIIGNKLFHEEIPNMDDFNIFNVNGQYVIEKNIKNKIVEIEYV